MNGSYAGNGSLPPYTHQPIYPHTMYPFQQPDTTAHASQWSTPADVNSMGRPLPRVTQHDMDQITTFNRQREARIYGGMYSDYNPPTPTEMLEEPQQDRKPRLDRFSQGYDESMEATIRPTRRLKPQLQQIHTSRQYQGQQGVYAPSPPGSASLPTTTNLGSPLMMGQQMNLQHSGGTPFIPMYNENYTFSNHASGPTTPVSDYAVPVPSSRTQSRQITPNGTGGPTGNRRGHRRMDSEASLVSLASIAHIDVESTKVETGISPEEVAKYIEGPNGDAKWTCKWEGCGHLFGRKENIRSHVQTHLGDRQYKCPRCEKLFVRQHDLKRHAKIHTGVRPYGCPCGQEFARQDALTRHRQRGMCVGALEGTVKAPAKRGRPPKNGRPGLEERKVKATRTRQKNLSVSSVSSTFTAYSMDSVSPTFETRDIQVEDMNVMQNMMNGLNTNSSTAPMPMYSSPVLPHTPLDSSPFVSLEDVMSPHLSVAGSHLAEHTPGLSPSTSSPASFLVGPNDPTFSEGDFFSALGAQTMEDPMADSFTHMDHDYVNEFSDSAMMYADEGAPFCNSS